MSAPTLRRHRGRFPSRYLDKILPMPRPMRSLEDWQRLRHRDVDALTDAHLDRELYLARHRRALDHDPARCAWLLEREAAVLDEINRQRSRR